MGLIDREQENYGRAKETHAHTQQLWEKEIRRARKETFKAQSALVKLQEELKSCRTAQKAAEDELQSEKERSQVQEQEAFTAKYNLVGLQEQFDQAQGRIKMLEQELDALKTLAKNAEDVRRLAPTDEDSVPRKRPRTSSISSSPTANSDLETLNMLYQWEKQRADRALEQVQFLEVECQLKVCPTGKSMRASKLSSPRRKRASLLKIADAGDPLILSENRRASPEPAKPNFRRSKTELLKKEREPRRSTVFYPAEGIFRTVSQAEAEAHVAKTASGAEISPSASAGSMPLTPTDSDPMFRRTPSVEPPDFAMLNKERTSLLSLLEAPHRQEPPMTFNIPTTAGPEPHTTQSNSEAEQAHTDDNLSTARPSPNQFPRELSIPSPEPSSFLTAPLTDPLPSTTTSSNKPTHTRPHTSTSYYPAVTTVTTTTKVPLREDVGDGPTLAQRLMKMQRTPSRNGNNGSNEDMMDLDKPSFDVNNPALTPTMTREEALAQIRERRGRQRSVGRGQPGAQQGGQSGNGSGSGSGAVRKVSGGSNASGSGSGRTSAMGERGRSRAGERREVSAPTGVGGVAKPVRGVSARRVRT